MDKETNFDFDNMLTDSGSLEGLFGETGDGMNLPDAQNPFAPPAEESGDGFSPLTDDWLQWDDPSGQTDADSPVLHTPPEKETKTPEPIVVSPQEALPFSASGSQPEADRPLPADAEPETEWEDDFGEDASENPFDGFSSLSDDWPDDWHAGSSKDDAGMPLWDAPEAPRKTNSADKGKGISPATARIIVPFAAFVIVMTVVCAVLFIGNGGWKKDKTGTPVTFSDEPYVPSEQEDTPPTTEPTDSGDTTQDQTTATTAATAYKPLKVGDRGQDVLDMQNRLLRLGYIGENSCTGYYGGYTQKRLAVFQKKAGLEQTGIADAVTLERLYASDAPKYA